MHANIATTGEEFLRHPLTPLGVLIALNPGMTLETFHTKKMIFLVLLQEETEIRT
jgi:hypothetical protein